MGRRPRKKNRSRRFGGGNPMLPHLFHPYIGWLELRIVAGKDTFGNLIIPQVAYVHSGMLRVLKKTCLQFKKRLDLRLNVLLRVLTFDMLRQLISLYFYEVVLSASMSPVAAWSQFRRVFTYVAHLFIKLMMECVCMYRPQAWSILGPKLIFVYAFYAYVECVNHDSQLV